MMICSFSSCRSISYSIASCMSCIDMPVDMSVVMLMASVFRFLASNVCLCFHHHGSVLTASQLCIYQELVCIVCRFCTDGFWVIYLGVTVMALQNLS